MNISTADSQYHLLTSLAADAECKSNSWPYMFTPHIVARELVPEITFQKGIGDILPFPSAIVVSVTLTGKKPHPRKIMISKR